MASLKDDVLATLSRLPTPDGRPLTATGKLSEIVAGDGKVFFSISVDAAQVRQWEPVRADAEKAVRALPGVKSVMIALTAERAGGGGAAPPPRPAPPTGGAKTGRGARATCASACRARRHSRRRGDHRGAPRQGRGRQIHRRGQSGARAARLGLEGRHCWTPTFTVRRCRACSPSARSRRRDGTRLKPIEKLGLKAMSIGFLVEEETPMIWRGPMVQSALTQMMREVAWAPLDVLVLDMPPGTGDAQLTMAQRVPLKGAVIVSTPQDIALIDARQGHRHVPQDARCRSSASSRT